MEPDLLDTAEIDPPGTPGAAVIWLHGLGADGHDFEPVVPALDLPPALALRFVFPHAPLRAVTINAGAVMRAWYDFRGDEAITGEDEEGIRGSEGQVRALIERERERGIPSERIVLAGFSQGGAIALQTGLRHPERLGGILALSTYLPLHRKVKDEIHEANGKIPIFMAHGTLDPLLPITLGIASKEKLEALGYEVEWRQYPVLHSVCPEEIRDIGAWLKKVLG